jgi:hypothetical protein
MLVFLPLTSPEMDFMADQLVGGQRFRLLTLGREAWICGPTSMA